MNISSTYSVSLFSSYGLSAYKIMNSFIIFGFFGYIGGTESIPTTETHLFTNNQYNLNNLTSNCRLTGTAWASNIVSIILSEPDSTGIKLYSTSAGMKYLSLQGILVFK